VPPDLRTYLKLVRAGFARQANYRLAMLAGLATNIVFGFIRAAILIAAINNSPSHSLGGYTAASISSYVWLSQGLIGCIELSGRAEIGDRVRTGDVAIDFTRPVDLQTWHLAEDMGRAAYTLIPRGLPSVLIGALTVGLVMPGSALPYLLGVLSIVAGVAISFYGRYAVNILGFWLMDTRGARTLYLVTSGFLAGLYVPVGLFPGWLHTVAYCTPFPSILQTPINVISGKVAGVEAGLDVAMQLGWLVVVCLIGRWLTNAGRRKLVLNGG
jgi:viologen exporter family transport system permease protein